MAEVSNVDSSRQGVHYWNRLHGGVEVDITREQFLAGEVVGSGRTVERPAELTGALHAQYERLAAVVKAALDDRSGPASQLA
jgi:hypothetical protein